MSTDFENGLRKTIDLSVRSREFTVDTLKSAMQDFLSGESQRKGRVNKSRFIVKNKSFFLTNHYTISILKNQFHFHKTAAQTAQ